MERSRLSSSNTSLGPPSPSLPSVREHTPWSNGEDATDTKEHRKSLLDIPGQIAKDIMMKAPRSPRPTRRATSLKSSTFYVPPSPPPISELRSVSVPDRMDDQGWL